MSFGLDCCQIATDAHKDLTAPPPQLQRQAVQWAFRNVGSYLAFDSALYPQNAISRNRFQNLECTVVREQVAGEAIVLIILLVTSISSTCFGR